MSFEASMRGLAPGLFGGIMGLRLIESPHLTIGPFEDWSDVRSPGRARRRRAKGHRQRIRLYFKPDPKVFHDKLHNVIYAHPVTAAAIRSAIPEFRP